MTLGQDDSDFTIWLRDQDCNRIAILDVYNEITAVSKFNKTGTWHAVIPTSAKIAQYITETTGIIIQYQGTTVFSGSAGGEYHETSTTITIGGVDDNVLLETPTRPTPSQAEGPYTDEYDVTTGVASTIMRSLVDRNIGPSAPVEWRIPNLTLQADPLLGTTLTSRTRFDPLNTMLAELASTPVATGLGFRILQDDALSSSLSFQIYEPRDKHLDTVFSVDIKTAQDYEYIYTTPSANYFIVAGGDNFGINRTVVEGGDVTSIAEIGRRVAVFVDRRGVENTSELEQELAELIAGVVNTRVINITPTKTPAIVFGDSFALGDYVTAAVKGVAYARLIRELMFEFSPQSGLTISPTIADPAGTNDDINAQHLDTVSHRISNIERNWRVPDDSIIEDMMHPTVKWNPGDIRMTGRSAAAIGWMLCNGAAISRITYSRLYSAIGTTFGIGDGSPTGTFNIPNLNDKYPIGKGTNHALGTSAGTTTINIQHSHFHSHGLSNHTHASQAHTHPLTHSHGITVHRHTLNGHQHDVDDMHDHGGFTGGPSSDTSEASGTFDVATNFHWHEIANDTMSISTDGPSTTFTGDGEKTSGGATLNSTESDNNVGSALYSGSPSVPSPNSSESDSTSGGSTTQAFDPPNVAVNYEIYLGIVPV